MDEHYMPYVTTMEKIQGETGGIPRSLPTNFTYAVPPPPPPNVSKMYQLSRVSSCHLWEYICPTEQFNFDGREDIIVFQTGISELSHFVIFYRACACVGCTVIFCQLLPVDPWNSVFASINDMHFMVRANNGVYYGLKVVFACLHMSLSPTS